MAADSMLYEACPRCGGVGGVPDPGTGELIPCPLRCTRLHVVAVGLTAGQVDRMARRERAEAEARVADDCTRPG
jgi:hypothetical protein